MPKVFGYRSHSPLLADFSEVDQCRYALSLDGAKPQLKI
jgi:hypothetical protein